VQRPTNYIASIGGYFAEPASNFPSVFPSTGLFVEFPYLLPNLICTCLLLVAITAGYFLLEETHPDMQVRSTQEDLATPTDETPLSLNQNPMLNSPGNVTADGYGTFNEIQVHSGRLWTVRAEGDQAESSSEKVVTKSVLTLIIALGIFTYHSVSMANACDNKMLICLQMMFDHLLPIFLQDRRADDLSAMRLSVSSLAGGLGLPLQSVGIIMSINGLIQLVIQGAAFPVLTSFFGVRRLLIIVTIGHPIAYILVPLLPLVPSYLLYPGIYTCLTIRSLTSILAYPLLLIMVKEATPGLNHLGKINGLAASTGAACRTVASPVAGLLYGVSINMHFTPTAWWAAALVAVAGAVQVSFIRRVSRGSHLTTYTTSCYHAE